MKGISATRLKTLRPRSIGRAVALLGVASLTVGGLVLGAGAANAAIGTVPGALTITPSSGPLTTTPTYSSPACKTGFQGSAVVKEVHTDGVNTNNVSQVNPNVAAPFSGSFQGSISGVEGFAGATAGQTIELVVYCYSGPSSTGSVDPEGDAWLTFSADGINYTVSPTPPVQPTSTTTLTASPNPAQTGQTVTLTATVTVSDASAAAGTVTFQSGGTAIGTPVAVGTGGVATTTTTFATAGSVSLTAVFTPSNAVTGSTSGAVTESVIPAGGFFEPLTVTLASTGSFNLTVATGTVTLTEAASNATASGTLLPITVTDTRNTYPGWSVSGQSAAFIDNTSNPPGNIPAANLGWAPSGTLQGGALLGPVVTAGSPGLGTAAVLAHAAAGTGVGTDSLSAGLTLNIPATAPAGTYGSNLTLTAVQTGP